jgi:hypothetical protein
MRVVTDILNYRQWRVVCDHCDWSSPNTDRLSEAVTEMNEHRAGAHVKVRPSTPAPLKPSQVGKGV